MNRSRYAEDAIQRSQETVRKTARCVPQRALSTRAPTTSMSHLAAASMLTPERGLPS